MRSNSALSCGPFDLIETIGRGGMAQVWRGIHRSQNPGQQVPVAVKVITGAKAADPEYVQRFEREVQAVAALDHPGIVTVFDYGVVSELAAKSDPRLTAGSPYLAMEFARGGTLRERPLIRDWPSLRVFILDILDALAYAHARDVIHRDLKPENILCQIDGAQLSFKLSDFGIAHAGDTELDTDTQSYDGASAGTPYYMPPEQITGEWRDFGPWTDLYALGCLVFEVVCGRRPFEESNFIRLANLHLNMPFPELEPRFAVPDELDGFIRKLVAKKPHERFQRAADAAFVLGRLPVEAEAPTQARSNVQYSPNKLSPDKLSPNKLSPDMAPTIIDPSTFADVAEIADLETQTLSTRSLVTLPLAPSVDAADLRDTSGETGADTIELGPVDFDPPPPLPPSWRTGEEQRASDQLVGVGLGLFGLRTIPFVDRDAQRDTVWQVLQQVSRDERVHVVSLRGGLGTGKSRLAEWLSRRAHELGGATVLKATHSRQGGPVEGIPRMLENFFAAWSLDRSQTYRRVYSTLQRRIEPNAKLDSHQIENQARGLTELMRPLSSHGTDDESPRFHFSSAGERHVWLTRFLEALAAERPVILWADDIPWGDETLGLVEFLLQAEEPLPVLVLSTSRDDMLEERAEVARRIDDLEGHERAVMVRVDPLAEDDHAELIRRTLRLDAALSRTVEERTAGNPLFAVQLIGDWVSRGILEVGRDGFSLRQGAASSLPRDIHDLWIQRVEKLLDDFDPARRRDLRIAMELAAMLGQYVDEHEWREVCAQSGVEASYELARRMVEQGLARLERDGAAFVHSMLAESLRESARRAGRAPEHHLACVRAIEVLNPHSPLETARRRALHLIGAGRLDGALEPLKDAIHFCNDRGDYRGGAYLLEMREELADVLGLAPEDRRRVENLWVRAQMEIPMGDTARALSFAERAVDIAQRHGWRIDVGHALAVKARVFRDRADYEAALDVLAQARTELTAVDDSMGLLFVSFGQGFIHIRLGKYAAARTFFDEALAHARKLEDQPRVAEILSQVGYTWFSEGRYDRARQILADALEVAERLGSMVSISSCSRHLGEIARFEGDWEQARTHYERAMHIEQTRGARNRHLDRLNLALVAIATHRFEHSSAELVELREIFAAHEMRFALPIIDVALAASAAGKGDLDGFDHAAARAAEALAGESTADKDIGWLAGRAATACEAAGWTERAARMRGLARQHTPEEG